MSMRRWADIGAAVVSAAIAIGLLFALRPQHTATVAATSPAPSTTQGPRPANTSASEPSVLFIGDSYTAGDGLAEMSPSCVAAVRMGWLCHLSAVPGTGYISGGPANRFTVDPYIGKSTSLSERIPSLAMVYQPDIVVLDGGRNDHFPPKDDVFKAMAATIADARRAWPTATIVVERPRFLGDPGDDLGFDDEFFARLKTQPGAEGLEIIDPISWFTGEDTSGMLGKDEIHPNQQGELELASALVNSFVGHGFAVKP